MAIELTTPEQKITKIEVAQITNVSLRLYQDGKNLGACSVFVEWRKGYMNGEDFIEVTRDNTTLSAEEVFTVLMQSQNITPIEFLLGSETPMDKIFVALTNLLKQKGKI